MSRLSQELRVVPGQGRRPSIRPLSLVQPEESTRLLPDYRQEYRIEAHLGGTVYLEADQAQVPSVVEKAKESVRRALIERVFGEFREPLAQLSLALYRADLEEAQEIASNIRRTMFDA